jgi:hypothetical protein
MALHRALGTNGKQAPAPSDADLSLRPNAIAPLAGSEAVRRARRTWQIPTRPRAPAISELATPGSEPTTVTLPQRSPTCDGADDRIHRRLSEYRS